MAPTDYDLQLNSDGYLDMETKISWQFVATLSFSFWLLFRW